jgi:hypothetical protein
MPLVRRVSRLCRLALPALLIAVAVTASAQINEQDRLNRCQNNRAQLVELGRQLRSSWDDEHVAKARTALISLRRLSTTMHRDESLLLRFQDPELNKNPIDVDPRYVHDDLNRTRTAFMATALSVGVACRVEDDGCPDRLIALIEKNIDTAVASSGEREAMVQEMARYRTNYMALRCDLPAQIAMMPDLAGTWYREGNTSLPASIAQNGGTLVFTNEMRPPMVSQGRFVSADEVVADQWEGGLVGIVSPDRRHIAWRNGTNWSR